MKKIILAILLVLTMTGCSSSKQDINIDTDAIEQYYNEKYSVNETVKEVEHATTFSLFYAKIVEGKYIIEMSDGSYVYDDESLGYFFDNKQYDLINLELQDYFEEQVKDIEMILPEINFGYDQFGDQHVYGFHSVYDGNIENFVKSEEHINLNTNDNLYILNDVSQVDKVIDLVEKLKYQDLIRVAVLNQEGFNRIKNKDTEYLAHGDRDCISYTEIDTERKEYDQSAICIADDIYLVIDVPNISVSKDDIVIKECSMSDELEEYLDEKEFDEKNYKIYSIDLKNTDQYNLEGNKYIPFFIRKNSKGTIYLVSQTDDQYNKLEYKNHYGDGIYESFAKDSTTYLIIPD